MATHKKKQQRRLRRRLRRREIKAAADKLPADFQILEASADCRVEIEAAQAGEDGKTKLSKFNMTAYTGAKIELAAFTYPVIVDLSGMKIPAKQIPVLRNHEPDKIVGHGTAEITASTIKASGVISGANDTAREVAESSANGFPWQASIGATSQRTAFIDKGEKAHVNGRTWIGPLYVARQSQLREISFVPLGADSHTSATVAANLLQKENKNMGFEQWLQAKGFQIDQLSEAQQTNLQAIYDAEQVALAASQTNTDTDDADDTAIQADGADQIDVAAQLREKAAAELERQNAIRAICAQYGDLSFKLNNQEVNIATHAIRAGWTVEQAELESLRISRPAAPAAHTRHADAEVMRNAIEAGLILRSGGQLDHPSYGPTLQASHLLPAWLRRDVNDDERQQRMDAAHRFADMSLVDLCGHACRLDGVTPPEGRSNLIQAAFSGSALTNVFTSSVNAMLLAAYSEAPDTTTGWVREADVPDFKTNDRITLAKGPSLNKLPRGGSADHANRSDAQESYKIARYAQQFTVDEQDIIDDRLGALSDTPSEMGLAARRLRPDLVYAIILANAALDADSVALFHADHSNLNAGAALTSATLIAAIGAVEKQQDNSVNLNLRASHLIVPSDLKHTGAELIQSSQMFVAGSTDARRGSANTIALVESLTLVADSRLANGVTDPATGTAYAGSATTWYLGSRDGRGIEVGYLRGSGRAPQSSSWRKTGEDGQWLLGWSVKMDIGAKALGYRWGQKNTA